MISRRFKLAFASGAAVGLVIVTGFGPLVRYSANRAAARYGATVAVADVVPSLLGVRLLGVDVTLEEVPAARVHLDEVVVTYGTSGRKVALHGGVVSAIGTREVVMRQAEAWRAHHLGGDGAGRAEGSAGRTTDLSGLKIRWQDASENPTESVSAADLRFTREGGKLAVSAAEASATLGTATVSVKNGRVELVKAGEGASYRLAALATDAVEAEVTLPLGKNGGALKDLGGLRQVKADPAEQAVDRATGAGAAVRGSLLSAARALDLLIEPAAKVRLGGVHARIHHASDVLNLGPGTLEVARRDGRLVVELTPDLRGTSARPATSAAPAASARAPGSPGDHEETLTFRLAVPLAEGGAAGAQEIVADVQGGPIWLSSLGVREGDFGLFDVGLTSLSTRSHLVLSADGRTLRIDGEGKVHALSVRSAALSDEPVAGLTLAFGLKGEVDLDGSRARIAEGELDLGAIRLLFKGDYDRVRGGEAASAPQRRRKDASLAVRVGEAPAPAGGEDSHRIRGSFEMPLTACQSMLEATPKGLVSKLHGMRMAGSFALRGSMDVDTAHLDRGFKLDWDASSSCRVTEAPPAVHVDRFKKPFHRTAYDPEGRPVDIETGPGTPDWVPYTTISKFMEIAVLTTEDGGFHRHHGFDHEAIKNSVRENLRKKKFVRGASTISMQLAKNLYLERGKTLSRKLQEAVLTMYLEQELTKEQIIELYLNVVEFGPMIYGIGPAARHYFSTSAHDLSLGQALYVASIMPNPKVQHFGSGGAVAPGWMAYLQKLMKIARERNRIAEDELEEGLRETVIRGSPAPQRSPQPANHAPIDPSAPALPYEPIEEFP
ncbi:Monofunctional biosynthetic peptidoglycan transglycosylase [Minicystis rosea]|nr:Monofunctional biosynthetic peptidoglycan transglycosylase [Minicystis rosea]